MKHKGETKNPVKDDKGKKAPMKNPLKGAPVKEKYGAMNPLKHQ